MTDTEVTGRTLDLVKEELRELGTRVVADAGNPPEPFGLYAFDASAPESELARAVERSVFDEFFGNSAEMLDAEYGPYEESTVFLCVMDQRRKLPAGTVRAILPSPRGFKSLHDFETVWERPLDPILGPIGIDPLRDDVYDITTIAVDADYRGKATDGLISLGLYQAIMELARFRGVRWLVSIMDLVVIDLIDGLVAAPFRRYPGVEPINYLDSPASVPVYCDYQEWVPRFAAAEPAMHDIVINGKGIEAAMTPLDLAPLLGPAHAGTWLA